MKFYTFCAFLFFIFTSHIKSAAVCDLELLILELKQDLDDNGILDCLRVINPPNGVIETAEQKNKRLSAQWDSSCAFESTVDWFTPLKKHFGITTLVDEVGEPVDHNLPDQADMCEIIRAAIAGGLFPQTSDVTNIPYEILNYIDCPGEEDSVKICAVNSISFYKQDMWTILLTPSVIQIGTYPNYIMDVEEKFTRPIVNRMNEIDRKAIKTAMAIKAPSDTELQKLISSSAEANKAESKKPNNPWMSIYYIHSNQGKESIVTNTGWRNFTSTSIEIKSNVNFHMIAYTMVSGFKTNSRISLRMTLDDVSQISTRMIQGYQNSPGITTGFISQLPVGTHRINTEYRTNNDLRIEYTSEESDNIISGAIIIPKSELYLVKVINPKEISLNNDNNWADFPNLFISNLKFKKTCWAILLYNLAIPGMKSHIVTRLEINSIPYFESRSIAGDSMYWGIHNAIIVKFLADVDYSIKLRYRTPFNAKSNPRTSDWEGQSLMLLELPQWVTHRSLISDEEFQLDCAMTWSVFPKIDTYIALEEDKTILFIYNVVLPLVEKKMTVGIFMNNLLEKKSVMTYDSMMYFKGVGYLPLKLIKGKYKIQLKYKTDACVTYRPSTDWQSVALSLVDMG